MLLEIVTPDQKLFSGEVNSISLPGTDGSFGILNNHAPLISTLREGTVKVMMGPLDCEIEESDKISVNDRELTVNVNGGVVEVLKNKVIILAE